MINHIRTLLLDENGSNKPGSSFPLEEFVPDSFKTEEFPNDIRRIWQTIFGTKPDRAYKNWRLFQLSELAQASDLFEDWFKFDSRATHFEKPYADYSNEYSKVLVSRIISGSVSNLTLSYNKNGFFATPSESATNQVSTQEDLGISVFGELNADDILGRSYSSWKADLNASGKLLLQSLNKVTPNEEYTLSFTENLSEAINLKSVDMKIKFRNEPGASWTFDIYARPKKDIGVVLANLDSVSSFELDSLFTGKYSELAKFKDYWLHNEDLAERITAITLALAYKIQEKREV